MREGEEGVRVEEVAAGVGVVETEGDEVKEEENDLDGVESEVEHGGGSVEPGGNRAAGEEEDGRECLCSRGVVSRDNGGKKVGRKDPTRLLEWE